MFCFLIHAIARAHYYKGVHYLVEVLPKLADDVVLEIVGTGPIKPFLEKRAMELKVYDRVRFYENLPRRELLQKFADADVFVLLSRFEAYSLVVAEALTAGTPCIVANTSALSEWIDNETCFGADFPISLNELARLIESVLDNGADKRAMKKWIGTKILDWNNVAYELESIHLKSEDH
jgi:glycosyltransferase involved in cell wall biosynthesis